MVERAPRQPKAEAPGRWRRRLGWAAMVVVVALLMLYVGVPMAVRYGGAAYASSQIRGTVSLGMVQFDPWSLTVEIADARVTDPAKVDVARVQRIVLNAELRSAWSEPLLVADELRLVRPWLNVARDASGVINLLELALPEESSAAEASAIPLVEIRRLSIEQAVVAVQDQAMDQPVTFAIEPADVTFENLQTRGGVANVHEVAAKLLGGDVTWQGTVDLEDLAVQGTIRASGLDLGRFHPYVLRYGGYAVAPGAVAELEAALDVNFAGGALQGTADVSRLVWTDLAVDAPHEGLDRAQIARLAVEGLRADVATLQASVAKIMLASIAAEPFGSIQQLTLTDVDVDGRRPALTVARAEVGGVASPYGSADALEATDLAADGSSLTLGLGTGRATQLAAGDLATVQQASVVELLADAAAQTARIDRIEVDGVAAELDRLLPDDGTQLAPAAGQVTEEPASARPAWSVQLGAIHVSDVQSTYRGQPLAAWQRLLVEQVQADTADLSAAVERVILEGPVGYLRITETGEVELEPLARSEQVMAIIRQLRGVRGSVGLVGLSDGRLELLDRSTPDRPAKLDAHAINVQVRDILQSAQTPTTFDLELLVGETGSLRTAGQANPLASPATIQFSVTGSDLPLNELSGYARRYLGYPIDRGAASLQLNYEMVYPDIAGSNDLVLDQFYLGEKDPDAEGLDVPVKFGLSVLRDRSGQIKLRVPIEGDLDNPTFDFRQIMTRAILNIVAKAVTSPFSLLAGIVGSDGGADDAPDAVADASVQRGDEQAAVEVRLAPGPQAVDADALSAVQFAAGSAALTAVERRELRMLARALYERPALTLTIMGEASVPGDAVALLREEARNAVREVLAEGRDQPVESVSEQDLDLHYERAVRSLYAELDAGVSLGGEQVLARLTAAARQQEQERREAQDAPPPPVEANGEPIAFAEEIDVPLTLAERAVLGRAPAPSDALAQLARDRAAATRDQLLAIQADLEDRIQIMSAKINGQSRANLSLALE